MEHILEFFDFIYSQALGDLTWDWIEGVFKLIISGSWKQ